MTTSSLFVIPDTHGDGDIILDLCRQVRELDQALDFFFLEVDSRDAWVVEHFTQSSQGSSDITQLFHNLSSSFALCNNMWARMAPGCYTATIAKLIMVLVEQGTDIRCVDDTSRVFTTRPDGSSRGCDFFYRNRVMAEHINAHAVGHRSAFLVGALHINNCFSIANWVDDRVRVFVTPEL